MNFIQKFNIFYRCQSLKYSARTIHISNARSAEEINAKSSTKETFDVLEDLREPELTEEEILRKRFKSRLPEMVYRRFIKKEIVELVNGYDFQMKRLRAFYVRYGETSNLNPGICWPTRQEILDTIEDDKTFEPPLEVRLKNVENARLAEEKCKQEVEEEVDKNMANLDKWMQDYHAKIEKKNAEAQALKEKKQKLIDEISEYLGYEIDPRDPRFKEAVEQKEKEKKKARKVQKQQESYDRMIAKLKQMAEK